MSEIKRALFRVKNSEGTYVTAHVQTESSMILHKDTNLEQFLEGFEPAHLAQIESSVELVHAKLEELTQTSTTQTHQLKVQQDLITEIRSDLESLEELLSNYNPSTPEDDQSIQELKTQVRQLEQRVGMIESSLENKASATHTHEMTDVSGLIEKIEKIDEMAEQVNDHQEQLASMAASSQIYYQATEPENAANGSFWIVA